MPVTVGTDIFINDPSKIKLNKRYPVYLFVKSNNVLMGITKEKIFKQETDMIKAVQAEAKKQVSGAAKSDIKKAFIYEKSQNVYIHWLEGQDTTLNDGQLGALAKVTGFGKSKINFIASTEAPEALDSDSDGDGDGDSDGEKTATVAKLKKKRTGTSVTPDTESETLPSLESVYSTFERAYSTYQTIESRTVDMVDGLIEEAEAGSDYEAGLKNIKTIVTNTHELLNQSLSGLSNEISNASSASELDKESVVEYATGALNVIDSLEVDQLLFKIGVSKNDAFGAIIPLLKGARDAQ